MSKSSRNARAARARTEKREQQYASGEISEAEYTYRQELADAAHDRRTAKSARR